MNNKFIQDDCNMKISDLPQHDIDCITAKLFDLKLAKLTVNYSYNYIYFLLGRDITEKMNKIQ